MALLSCVKCGENYSDSLPQCPHCGFEPRIFVCPECGGIYGTEDSVCHGCGFRLESVVRVPAGENLIRSVTEKLADSVAQVSTVRQAEKNMYLLNLLSGEAGVAELTQQNQEKMNALLHHQQLTQQYDRLVQMMQTEGASLPEAIALGESLGDFRDAPALTAQMKEQYLQLLYQAASDTMATAGTAEQWLAAAKAFEGLGSYQDAAEKAALCHSNHQNLVAAKKQKTKKIGMIVGAVILVIAIIVSSVVFFIPNHFYNTGAKLFESGQYTAAAEAYAKAGDFKDAPELVSLSLLAQSYADGEAAFASGDYLTAQQHFLAAGDYLDAVQKAAESLLADYHSKGCGYLEQQNWDNAIAAFLNAKGYSDSAEKLKEAYYGKATESLSKGLYLDAALNFAQNLDYLDSLQQIMDLGASLRAEENYSLASQVYAHADNPTCKQYALYCLGMDYMQTGDYENAIGAFAEAGDVEDSRQMLPKAYYLQGIAMMVKGAFTDAKTCFVNAGEYEHAAHLIKVCEAEIHLAEGYLNAALEAYRQVPKNLQVDGFDIAKRIAQVENVKGFAAICGVWKPTKNFIESKCQYRFGSRWWNWYWTDTFNSQSLTIRCYLNDDGTVRVEGTVTFYRCTNYHTVGSYVNPSSTTKTFTLRNQKSVPYSFRIDSYATLSYGSGTGFQLKYSFRDEGTADFYFLYNTDVTFGTRKTIY